MMDIIMKETTTLGVRVRPVARHVAQRESVEIESSLGHAGVKVKRFAGDIVMVAPEYDDCRRIAAERKLPFSEVRRIIEEEARIFLSEHGSRT